MTIESMTEGDWETVRRIYTQGIATGDATFETKAPDWRTWNTTHRSDCRLVARDQESVVGWAALSPVSERCVHRDVAEISVYVDAASRGKGIGKALLQRLIELSETAGLWTLQAGVFPENLASVRVQESCGFRQVGLRERLGELGEQWRDVLLLERRSKHVGAHPAPDPDPSSDTGL